METFVQRIKEIREHSFFNSLNKIQYGIIKNEDIIENGNLRRFKFYLYRLSGKVNYVVSGFMSDTWSICGPWRLETFSEDIPHILVTAHFNNHHLEGEIYISYEKEDNEKKR